MKMKLLKDTKHETENLNNKSNFYINNNKKIYNPCA